MRGVKLQGKYKVIKIRSKFISRNSWCTKDTPQPLSSRISKSAQKYINRWDSSVEALLSSNYTTYQKFRDEIKNNFGRTNAYTFVHAWLAGLNNTLTPLKVNYFFRTDCLNQGYFIILLVFKHLNNSISV